MISLEYDMQYIVISEYVCSGSSVVNDLQKEVNGSKAFPVEFNPFYARREILDLKKSIVDDWDFIKTGETLNAFVELANELTSNISPVYCCD